MSLNPLRCTRLAIRAACIVVEQQDRTAARGI